MFVVIFKMHCLDFKFGGYIASITLHLKELQDIAYSSRTKLTSSLVSLFLKDAELVLEVISQTPKSEPYALLTVTVAIVEYPRVDIRSPTFDFIH